MLPARIDLIDIVEAWIKEHPRFSKLYIRTTINDNHTKVIVIYAWQPQGDRDTSGWIMSLNEHGQAWYCDSRNLTLKPEDPKFIAKLEELLDLRLIRWKAYVK